MYVHPQDIIYLHKPEHDCCMDLTPIQPLLREDTLTTRPKMCDYEFKQPYRTDPPQLCLDWLSGRHDFTEVRVSVKVRFRHSLTDVAGWQGIYFYNTFDNATW